MPAPLSLDLRTRIISAYEAGGVTQDEVAARFDVGVATVVRLVARKRRVGTLEPAPNIGGRPLRKVDECGEELIKRWLRADPSLTIFELTTRFNEEGPGPTISTASMSRALIRLGWTRKKRRL